MPELPEVETVADELNHWLPGQCIVAVQLRWPRAIALPATSRFEAELPGRRIVQVVRRGKFVVMQLAPDGWLLAHLRMTGRLLRCPATAESVAPSDADDAYTRVRLDLDSGDALCFRDVRKFGRLYLVADPDEVLGKLGPEPLSATLSPTLLAERLRGRSRQIKPLLLDQSFLAGLGNIYVDEALWLAGLHPQRAANSLDEAEVVRLHAAIRQVLQCAIAHRGTTLRDYRDPQGRAGANQFCLQVYGRQGARCERCGDTIRRMVVGQRGTHYCPTCQVPHPTPPEADTCTASS